MKKYLILGLLVFVPFLTKADTQVFGFSNGSFYDVNGNALAICFLNQTCLKADNTVVSLTDFLGLSTSTPQTVTVVTGTPTPPPAPVIIYVPVPTQPTQSVIPPNEPISGGEPQATTTLNLLPPYTQSELLTLIGIRDPYITGIGPSSTYHLPTCYIDSSTSAECATNGANTGNVKFEFNGQVIWDGSLPNGGSNNVVDKYDSNGKLISVDTVDNITGLTPDTTYTDDLIYSEVGRQDTDIVQSFTTPLN